MQPKQRPYKDSDNTAGITCVAGRPVIWSRKDSDEPALPHHIVAFLLGFVRANNCGKAMPLLELADRVNSKEVARPPGIFLPPCTATQCLEHLANTQLAEEPGVHALFSLLNLYRINHLPDMTPSQGHTS